MKILAFTDTHADPKAVKKILEQARKLKPDLLISCGDLSWFTDGLDKTCREINKTGITILSIHGNHEMPGDMEKVYKKYSNFLDLHCGVFEMGDYVFFGHGGGGFLQKDKDFDRIAKKVVQSLPKNKKLIFITHMPPFNTKLDEMPHDHVGSKSYRKFIEKVKPFLALSGHIEENFHAKDKIGSTKIINPGPSGRLIELK